MEVIIFLVIGVLIGCVVSKCILKEEPIGTLRVDQSDPDSEPYLFLELSANGAYAIQKKKYVSFKVDLRNYISQE